jgi:AcrR family transcriptional regulator
MTEFGKVSGRRSVAEAQATRNLILSVALERFSERGFDSVSVREIATHAGVTHGMIRHHFGSKMDVWKCTVEGVFDHYRDALLPKIEAALNGDEPLNDFREVVSEFIRISLINPVYARILVRESEAAGERAEFCAARFQEIHVVIGELFSKAKAESTALSFHTNDSFFNALMSLTFFGILHPSAGVEPEYPLSPDIRSRADLILAILFGRQSQASLDPNGTS